MSCITDSKTLEDVFQPSLIYPSLTSYSKKNGGDPNEKTDIQACIHFASRLIKLRSELRSSSYMSSSTSLQLLKTSSTSSLPESSSVSSIYSSSSFVTAKEITPGLSKDSSKTGRVYSLPNVKEYCDDHSDSTSFMNDREDESEIMDRILSMNGKRETSQLTHLVDIIRHSMRQRQDFYSQSDQFYLALPPKSLLHQQKKKSNSKNSTATSPLASKSQKLLQKSASLRDIILTSSQDEKKTQQEETLLGYKYHHQDEYPSFSLASQLVSASTAHPQGGEQRKEKKKQKATNVSSSSDVIRTRSTQEKSASSLYHDSDDGDSDTESDMILRHAVPATAFLVSLSPSAAAAASAARFRRRRPVRHKKDSK
ncbi:hypothetical protein K501DRAFT_268632 [Backusella circina FSU 941]|nr:hypothetical protein K501DRAFT_268632 [Backusella circina FSU 941]